MQDALSIRTTSVDKWQADRVAVTLVELLVVISIISLLMGLLVPAVMMSRESARRVSCQNNMRQSALAVQLHATAHNSFPPITGGIGCDLQPIGEPAHSWSVFVRILPELDLAVAERLRLSQDWTQRPGGDVTATMYRPSVYFCPSAAEDTATSETGIPHQGICYAINWGIWDKADAERPQVRFGFLPPNKRLSFGDFEDGLSHTIEFAEVKPYLDLVEGRQCFVSGYIRPVPQTVAEVLSQPVQKVNVGKSHSRWVDAHVGQTGFTTIVTPNTNLRFVQLPASDDADWIDVAPLLIQKNPCRGEMCPPQLGWFAAAAVPSRSFHSGLVNVAMIDASVRTIDNGIDLEVWRALSTRNGREILPALDWVLS